MNTILVGLGSKARIGKDFAAAELAKMYDLERVAFADELKKDVAEMMKKSGLDYWALEKDPVEKEKLRPLLVEYGCTMRSFYQDVWVDRALKDKVFTHEITLVTDVRFPNEAKKLKELGGIFIDIQTDTPPANETEAHYAPIMADLADGIVRNNFDSKFIPNLVFMIESLNALKVCQTPSLSSNITPSTEEDTSLSMPIRRPSFLKRSLIG